MEELKGLILSGRQGHAAAPDHAHEREAARAGRQQARALLRHRGDGRRPASARSGSSSRPRPATRSATPSATARSSGSRSPTSSRTSRSGSPTPCSPPSDFLGASPFVMYLGDNLLQGGIAELVDAFRANAPDALILLTPVPDPENYGVAELDGDRVVRLVEKPPEPATDLALVGVYMFTPAIHDCRRGDRALERRGELEITDAIQHLVDRGMRVEPHVVRGWWKDTGRLDDMLEANRLILDNVEHARRGRADRLAGRRPRGRRAGRAAGALDRARARGHRRRRAPDRRLRRPLHRRGRGLRDRERRGRALDPARRLVGARTSTGAWSPRCWAATSRFGATTASRARTASWSATTPRSGSSDARRRHRRGGHARARRAARGRARRHRRHRAARAPSSTSPTATPCTDAIAAAAPGRGHQLRRLDRRRRRRGARAGRAGRQRHRRPATSRTRARRPARASCMSRPTTSSTARRRGRTWSATRSGRSAPTAAPSSPASDA